MSGQYFPIKHFFPPSSSAVFLGDKSRAATRRYNFVSLPNNTEVKARAMKNVSHNPKRLAQAQ